MAWIVITDSRKKKVHSVLRFFKELVSKNGEADELQLRWGNLWHVVNFTKMKWNFFLLESYIRLIFNSIWSILSTSLEMVSFGIQTNNCLVSLSKTKTPIVFSFPRDKSILISCNIGAFSRRQQFPYYRYYKMLVDEQKYSPLSALCRKPLRAVSDESSRYHVQ